MEKASGISDASSMSNVAITPSDCITNIVAHIRRDPIAFWMR